MADVCVETNPESETTVVTKTIESKVADDGTTESVVTTEETVVENGVHTNGDTTEESTTEVGVNNVAEEEPKENGVEENGDVAKVEEPGTAAVEGAECENTTAVDAEGNAEAVIEEPKEEVIPKVILHQFPIAKHIPNLSPFCLKLETFLRINKIPYENQYGYKMGKKGKLPWIEYKGERKADSNLIIDYLNETFEVNIDTDFTGEQLAFGRAARIMLEENTYWALIFNRYVDNLNEYKKFMPPPSGGSLGFSFSQKMFQRKMRSNLDGHGLGRHTREELYKIAEQDLKAVSDLLGEKAFLLGDTISSYDCAVFGLCANILYSGMESPLSTYIKENAANLSALCERVKEAYWQDWEEICEKGEKIEPNLKKGFSFRKKKTKTPKQKDAPADEAQADEAAATEENTTAEENTENNTPDEKPVENGDLESPAEEVPAVTPTETTAETPTESETVVTEAKETESEPVADTTTVDNTATEPDKEA